MRFQPGQSGNPAGRPKNSYSEYTQKFLTLRTKAANDVDKVYAGIMEAIERGEQWAYKLYLDHLAHFPIKEYQQTAKIKIRGNTAEEVINSCKEGLAQIEEYTADDLQGIAKTFNTIKLTERVTEKINEAAGLSDEQIKAVTGMVIEMNKNNDVKVDKND